MSRRTVKEAEAQGFLRGQREAFSRVMNMLNTYDELLVLKKEIYKAVSKLEPLELKE